MQDQDENAMMPGIPDFTVREYPVETSQKRSAGTGDKLAYTSLQMLSMLVLLCESLVVMVVAADDDSGSVPQECAPKGGRLKPDAVAILAMLPGAEEGVMLYRDRAASFLFRLPQVLIQPFELCLHAFPVQVIVERCQVPDGAEIGAVVAA
jgi:hypothetical protein